MSKPTINIYVNPKDHVATYPDKLDGDMHALTEGESEMQWLCYLGLKDSFDDVRVCTEYPKDGIFVTSPGHVEKFIWNPDLLVVSLQWDFPRDDRAQIHLVSNRLKTSKKALGWLDRLSLPGLQYYIPPIMHPIVIPRNPERGDLFENIAFIGRRQSLDSELESDSFLDGVRELGMNFTIVDDLKEMSDYSNFDVTVAVRKFGNVITNKPAVKLFNAWRGGVPAILGCEVGYREERESEYDYIAVDSVEEVLSALRLLKNDPVYRSAMVANASRRAKAYEIDEQLQPWIRFFENTVVPAHSAWLRKPKGARYAYLCIRWTRYLVRRIFSLMRRRILRSDAAYFHSAR